jgi:hypothetical protein
MKNTNFFFLTIVLLTLFACNSEQQNEYEPAPEDALFQLLSPEQTGIHFVNELNDDPNGVRNILSYPHYYNGAGLAIGDVNNDGLPDIFFAANEGPNRLYLNKGNLQFEDVTESSGINNKGKYWSTGAVMADVNGDGWLDIYVCQAGYSIYENPRHRANLLLINNGDGTFTDRAAEYGVDCTNDGTSAAFFDYDGDGDLDLYVLNESKYAMVVYEAVFRDLQDKEKLRAASGKLYRNDGGKFTDVTEQAGLLRYGFGLGLVVTDINDDGRPDIYVANDYSVPDFMFINNGDGTFTDRIKEKTRQISFFAMGADIADFNNDGFVDIAVVDMAANDHIRDKTLMASMDVQGFWFFVSTLGYQHQYMFNSLQLNNGNGTFSNIAALAGLLRSDWSWASLLADFDNDGLKDYFVTTGYRRYARDNDFRADMARTREQHGGTIPLHLRPDIYARMPEVKDVNFMYRNNGDLTFSEVSNTWGLPHLSYSNGAAYADLDGDGDLDLVINNIDHEAFVYQNLSREKEKGNYLQFAFEGETPATPVYNTKVTLHYGDQLQFQEFHPVRGYASSMEPIVHFGLGEVTNIDRVHIVWQNGQEQVIRDVAVNQRITLKRADAGKPGTTSKPSKPELAFREVDLNKKGAAFRHRENEYDDFAVEVLLPHRQSTLGPKIAVGDVNGDGLDDYYIGGAANQPGALFVQLPNGNFQKTQGQPWEEYDAVSEDMGALFFDADGDGDLDLYVVSGGGGEFPRSSPALQDRLYINNGQGQFVKVNAFGAMQTSGNVVVAADFDGDGDLDLFVGGAAVPQKYPYAERSYLLRNDGRRFTDVTSELAPGLERPGMVKDAVWADINNDGQPDLILVGEWMPVMIFLNEGGRLRDVSEEYGTAELKGWWYSVAVADLDNNGHLDLVVGNLGLNTKFSASPEKPFNVFSDDFDGNGTNDIVLSKEYKGQLVPSRGRQCSSEQMPFIREKFPTFNDFAHAGLKDILGAERLANALHLQVNTYASTVLMNQGGRFESRPLPNLAQIAPINRILIDDVNDDGIPDLIIAGNMHEAEVETPRYDAGNGLVLLGKGNGEFRPLAVHQSGFFAPGNVKDLAILRNTAGGERLILIANNNAPVQAFSFRPERVLGMR